ncbi:NAD-dependent dihydropyrimidine dehydrogenase PreA subunit [Pseudochelatococcus lubricantis]|uniref:NAD-dependent dihydropyrimidine dehydrogenase PreA subunit n=1 Tax=Pseudochelatococcus lubricantis TaxID=1538102 RepID=A0ABX0V3G6_9HYPH|nr:ferredoxin family protein [Pseudochelatococcus lubricantis]NIJ59693.1 NAD-dependent dihydropyrimidine dehydrogenase PreA subunit [Pseudochelatococcus lubricantis]
MIEVISEDRCTSCNICVNICPTNVFDAVKGGIPLIARQDDCQTCFMCEAYCPEDALYVAQKADGVTGVTAAALEEQGAFGSYRRSIGWTKEGRTRPAPEIMSRLDHH